MSDHENARSKVHKVLITLSEEARDSIDGLAAKLEEMGLAGVEVFSLGGVIAGEATNAELAEMRRLPEVAGIEDEPNLSGI